MEVSEAIYASVLAIYTADTGSGGLNETSGANRIERFVRQGDPNYDADRAIYWPACAVDIFYNSRATWGVGSSATDDKGSFILRLTLRTLRDPAFGKQNDIASRLVLKYDGVRLANQTGWGFSPLSLIRASNGPPSSAGLAYVIELEGQARAVATTGNSELVGREASVTFAHSSWTGIGSTLVGYVCDTALSISTRNVTRWYDCGSRELQIVLGGTVTVDFGIVTSTPKIPDGTPATLVFSTDTANGKAMSMTGLVRSIQYSAPEGNGQQRMRVTFAVTTSGPAGSAPITAT